MPPKLKYYSLQLGGLRSGNLARVEPDQRDPGDFMLPSQSPVPVEILLQNVWNDLLL